MSSGEETLFESALGMNSGADRDAFLAQACAGQPELLQRVRGLLDAYERGRFLEESPSAVAAINIVSDEILAGTTFGPYRLIRRIGTGGMGTVYLAEQSEPIRRSVAVKLMRPEFHERLVMQRFRREQQTLALMDHPNIARVLEAAVTPNGIPYLVMELVKGVTISEYCRSRELTVQDRLKLFRTCCFAIHHAHQRGIIHRDIKPSNVLVSEHDGAPLIKIIDFGIARRISHSTTEPEMFATVPGFCSEEFLGTPEFMSPEQASMGAVPVDQRTDIYSLGALLYAILTGRPPFEPKQLRASNPEAIRKILNDVEPVPPSRRLWMTEEQTAAGDENRGHSQQPLKGVTTDLDRIVAKAMHKDADQRYCSVADLICDVDAFLSNRPVSARHPSLPYRLRKFLHRRQRLITLVTLILLSVYAGFAVSRLSSPAGLQQMDGGTNESTTSKSPLPSEPEWKAIVSDVGRAEHRNTLSTNGRLTTTFGLWEEYGGSGVWLPDGKLVVAGSAFVKGYTCLVVVRLNRDGSLDSSFGDSGRLVIPFNGHDSGLLLVRVARQSSGQLILSASLRLGGTWQLVAIGVQPNGVLNSAFGTNGIRIITQPPVGSAGTNLQVYASIIQPDDRILIGGRFEAGAASGGMNWFLIRLLPMGELDNSFGADGFVQADGDYALDELREFAILPDGKIAAAGLSQTRSLDYRCGILLFTQDGRPVPPQSSSDVLKLRQIALGEIVSDESKGLILQPDGQLVIGATRFSPKFNSPFGGVLFVRLNAGLELDSTFGGSGWKTTALEGALDQVSTIGLQSDGGLIAAGMTNRDGNKDMFAARYTADGRIDEKFGTNGFQIISFGPQDDFAEQVLIDVNDEITLVGTCRNNTSPDFAIARLTKNGRLMSEIPSQTVP